VRHHGCVASQQPQRSIKISADERGGWSSDRPRRDGAPPRPANLYVHCRVLAPEERLRYSPGSLLVVTSASIPERDAFLARAIEDRAAVFTPSKVRRLLEGRVGEDELDERAAQLLQAAVRKRLDSRQTVVLGPAGLAGEEREPFVRIAAELGRPRHLLLLETARERVHDDDAAPLNELRRALDAGDLGAEGFQTALRLSESSAAQVRRIAFRLVARED
jgi:hypothetical protein